MKKLLVAAIGAAAAIGAFADTPNPITELRFESADFVVGETNSVEQLNANHGGTYWTNSVSAADNTYVIEAANPEGDSCPLPLGDNPTKALNVKTKFGNPLSVNVNDGGAAQTIGADGVYFDSLVKFTVCDDAPTNQYSGAKIVLWLQEDEAAGKTNLYVNAGYLKYDNVNGVQVSNAIYKCGTTIGADFADKWHRVTIKAIANITTSTSTSVPGFAIFIDGSGTEVNYLASCNDAKWDTSFTDAFQFTDAVADLKTYSLFPSLDQTSGSKLTISNTSFDGTGSITDIAFYDVAPEAFAEDAVAAEVTGVIVDNVEQENIKTFAAAVEAANGASTSAKITLNKSFTIAEALAFSGTAEITLDFAGFVLTNELADAAITNSAATLIITNSVGNGGIYCTKRLIDEYEDWGMALYNTATLTIQGGNFWGYITTETATVSVTGGGFASIDDVFTYIAPGKKYSQSGDLYVISDKESYTVTYDTAGGLPAIDSQSVMEGDKAPVPETVLTKTGYTFAGWSPDIATTTITGPTTFTAQWTIDTYLVTFKNGEDTFATTNVAYNTVAVAPVPAPTKTGYTFDYWYTSDSAVEYDFDTPVTAAFTLNAKFTADTYTVTFYTNSVVYTTANYTYGDESSYSAPSDPSIDGYTFGGWYTDNNTFESAFTFDENVAGNTQVAYAKLTQSGGGSEWDPDPSVIDESKTAAQEYPALADTPLATANAKKLTVWAKANSVTLSDAKSATSALVESYLLNCAPANLEAEKAAFKLDISFDGSGNPVVTLPDGKAYNVTPTMKGSNDLSTWTVIYSTTGYQFFKYELSL